MELFVYGTLRRGGSHPAAVKLHQRAEWLRCDACKGELYDFGAYPALTLPGTTWVHGDVFCLDDAEFAWLDAYEGQEYGRQNCLLFSGLRAQVYVYLAPLPPTARWIENGRWPSC